MATALTLRPTYWANVSGGKDSLYMLNLILQNPDKYPLDGVIHFELEIDYPFIKDVIDYMKSECARAGIPFLCIKPRKTWEELYQKYGYPTRKARWCNGGYKLDCKRQLVDWMKAQGCYVVSYVGYCLDEEKRYYKRGENMREVYPLVQEGIVEDTILQWAKTIPQYNNYYTTNRRCGCMGCPMSSYIEWAYLYKYYPEKFWYFVDKMRETEKTREEHLGRPYSVLKGDPKYNADYMVHIVETKWLQKLNEMEENCGKKNN